MASTRPVKNIDSIIRKQISEESDGCLEVKNIPLSINDIKKIKNALKSAPEITQVRLLNCNIDDDCAKEILNIARANKNITLIDIDNSKISFEISHDIKAAVTVNMLDKMDMHGDSAYIELEDFSAPKRSSSATKNASFFRLMKESGSSSTNSSEKSDKQRHRRTL